MLASALFPLLAVVLRRTTFAESTSLARIFFWLVCGGFCVLVAAGAATACEDRRAIRRLKAKMKQSRGP